ncbi:MAG: cell surface protein SprA [Bacteroidales bacterium]|nr:cell surface protein SprA [Bacteroidales bacterium]
MGGIRRYIAVCGLSATTLMMTIGAPLLRPHIANVVAIEPRMEISAAQDTTEPLRYPIKNEGDIPEAKSQGSSFDLKDPDNAEYSAEYDAETGMVTIYRKMGGLNVRMPYSMSIEEYQNDKIRRSMMDYWMSKREQASPRLTQNQTPEEQQKNTLLNSKWKVNSDLFKSVFGSDMVTMKLQGQAKVSIGVQSNRIDNPTMQERMRKNTSFDFDESIQLNLNAQIGERMKLGINYNTDATFDFENEVKLAYTGTEDDIIQNIEAGNINWSLPGTLIQGSQSLFGFKMDMKFGKLSVSTVFSQKKGETSSITVQGGATKQEFDIDITDYEKNKHFFLSHKFKDLYDGALKSLPTVNTPITINKIEVWVTNTSGNYNNARNVLAFVDLGETGDNMTNANMWRSAQGAYPSNDANDLYKTMTTTYANARTISNVTTTFNGISGFKASRSYEKIENARLLTSSEYTLNENLGYISLNTPLNNNEVLAVAYQYTYRGQTYQVGEFSNSGVDAPQCLYLKLIKGTTLTPSHKTWQLMMKNIYSLGAYDIEAKDFNLNIVYCNDSTNQYLNYLNEGKKPMYGGHNGETYLQILNLDRLNSNNDVSADGKYDFVDGITILASKGRIIFPEREPFGSYIAEVLEDEPSLAKKFAFTALYDSTQVYAKQQTHKNKFKIRGTYSSKSSSDIPLNAFNLAQGSVIVTAGGQVLTENVDYTVDYSLGRVKIINQSIANSGTAINISYENESAISTQTQTLVGTHLNYQFSDNFNIGATVIHMKEKPLTYKVAYGEESVSNTMLGLNTEFEKELPFITKALDALPMLSTKEKSTITFEGEIAKLVAGHTKSINASYIDDFEGSSVSYDIKSWTAWKMASKPQGQKDLFPDADLDNDLRHGYDRAKLAWYTIDPLFLRSMTTTPRHIKNDPEQQSSHYVREVYEEELYPNKESAYGESTNISILNLAYYPNERGQYNFTRDVDKDGFLREPEEKWAGIQRKLETTDFETNNVEYIEFWMLDPFIYTKDKPNAGGDLYFNVGTISEDVLKDSRKSFENGLPTPSEPWDCDSTAWGYVPRNNSLVNSFNTDPASMRMQDVGLNGMDSEKERTFYSEYVNDIEAMHANGELTDQAYQAIISDPASDDYHYYRGSDYDAAGVNILDRYKRFNNQEGNSCPSEYSPEAYSTASMNHPDNEDLNNDYTLSETENYYQYKVSLYPDSMIVGKNYIADMMETSVKLKNGKSSHVRWYQFKIPLRNPDKVVGDIADMSSMMFMRMFMKNFADTCILRFATLDLVKGEWRKYTDDLWEDEQGAHPSTATVFTTSTVNIEENDRRVPVNYVLPPTVDRQVDPSNPQLRQLNEQAYSLKVIDLGNADARAIYKTINLDIRNYKRLKMYIHAEAVDGYPLEDNQMSAFVRLGTDYEDNYYEYEIPLKLTPHGTYSDNNETDRYAVWPEENELDIPLNVFTKAKVARNDAKRNINSKVTLQDIYTISDPDKINNRVRIKGNPSLGNVVTMMIGLRSHGAGTKSAEIWVNELRLTDFDGDGGWAARGRTTIKLADLGSISASGQYASIGWGSIDQSTTERAINENAQFDISASLELGKLMGVNSRISMPFYASYSKNISTPEYSPYDTDVRLRDVLSTTTSRSERDSIKAMSQTTETVKSINVTNMRLKPEKGKKAKIYSPSNLSASYSITETTETDPETEYDKTKEWSGTLAYNYTTTAKPVEPFKKTSLDSKKFAIIKDFNFYYKPTLIAYRWELNRNYQEVQKRNVTNPEYKVPVSVSKDFNWDRYLEFKYNLTKTLKFSLSAATNSRIDEPDVAVNKERFKEEYEMWRDSVWQNIKRFGRATNYQHSGDLSWNVPINKLPYLDWLTANAQYKGTYIWQAGNLNTEYDWGNYIQNRNTKQLNSMANLSTMYNKSAYLKDIYNKYNWSSNTRNQSQKKNNGPSTQTVKYTEQNVAMKPGKVVKINHKLKTTDVSARAFDDKGRTVKGTLKAIDENNAEFTPTANANSGRIVITGTITQEEKPGQVVKDIAMIALTSLKSISVSYSENNSTALPGYLPGSHFAGTSSDHGSLAPGFAFLVGMQDKDFAMTAIKKGWITSDTTLNEPYAMTRSTNLQIRVSFEMFKALKVELSAQRSHSNSMTEYYVFNSKGFDNVYSHNETGSFSMTYNAWGTIFSHVGRTGTLNSEAFNRFIDTRRSIGETLASRRGLQGNDGYSETAQEVMIPAFVAAYTNKGTKDVFTSFIPSAKYMRPNWKVTFSGLNNIKALKDIVRNIELSHAYTSKYTIGSYNTNLDWKDAGDGISYIRDLQNNFIPEYEAATVSISDQLNPFIGISATFVNNLTSSITTSRTRNLVLSLSNNQITETYGKEWSLNLGYRFDNVPLFIGKKGEEKQFNNDLNLTLGLSQRDNYTILRRIEEKDNELASGTKTTSVKFSADYAFTQKFSMQFYYDQSIGKPYISSSYPTNNVNVGISFILSLTE